MTTSFTDAGSSESRMAPVGPLDLGAQNRTIGADLEDVVQRGMRSGLYILGPLRVL